LSALPRDHSTVSKNRYRLLEHDVIVGVFNQTVEAAHASGYLLGEHFSANGPLIRAWAGHKLRALEQVR
jgi:hypothetical protein